MLKKTVFIAYIFCISIPLSAQTKNNFTNNTLTINSTIKTLYTVISGEKGEARNWDLFRFLFMPNAKLIPTGMTKKGQFVAKYISPQEYINSSGKWLIANGFYEKEIHRTTQIFGNIAQVFSTYESYKSSKDTTPFMRGINSIQLLHDGKRWWIVNIYWQQETAKNPIPAIYLPQ